MSTYLIALGSNRRHVRHGRPGQVLRAAVRAMEQAGMQIVDLSPVIGTAPLGPSRRRYANAAAVVRSPLDPDALLCTLKSIERQFGRRRGGQRWAERVLDLDIVLWSRGPWASPGLVVPHVAFRDRPFVLGPAMRIAPDWRDPLTGHRLRQLFARLTRRQGLPKRHGPAGTGP